MSLRPERVSEATNWVLDDSLLWVIPEDGGVGGGEDCCDSPRPWGNNESAKLKRLLFLI